MGVVAGADDERVRPGRREHRVEVGRDRRALRARACPATTASRAGLRSQSPTSSTCSAQVAGTSRPQVPAPRWPVPTMATAACWSAPLPALARVSNSAVTIRGAGALSTGKRRRPMTRRPSRAPTSAGAAPPRRPRDPGARQARHPGRRARGVRRVRPRRRPRRPDRRAGRRQQAHALPLHRQQGGALRPRAAPDAYRDIRERRDDLHLGEPAAARRRWRSSSASPSTTSAATRGSSACSRPRTSSAAPSSAPFPRSARCTRRSSPSSPRCSPPARPRASSAAGVDPVQLYITLDRRQLLLPLEHPHPLGDLRHPARLRDAQMARRRAHAIEVVLGYLRP